MQIYINNRAAALKKGSSFEYVAENRLFSDSDGYTLSITFPLRDCPDNLAIFGHINRADVAAQKVIFNCEIRDKGFSKFGSITITEISETEVKTQFLEGRSEQNFDKTFDKLYINELDLGEPEITAISGITPEKAWSPIQQQNRYVALPWVNSDSGNLLNLANYIVDDEAQGKGHWEWDKEKTVGLSWQPYLLWLTKQICAAVGYSCDLSAWEEHEEYRYLLVCNTIPAAWDMPDFRYALPNWTVEEYFRKLELFLGAEFDIDHRAQTIRFAFTDAVLKAKPPVMLPDVVEEHTKEISIDEDNAQYLGSKNLVYKECSHNMWKFYSCDWFVKSWKENAVKYPTLEALIEANKHYADTWTGWHHRDQNLDKLLYAADCDTYFIIRAVDRKQVIQSIQDLVRVHYRYVCILQPVNLFGGRIVNDSDDAAQEEIDFVPAWIDETRIPEKNENLGDVIFLDFGAFDSDTDTTSTDDEKHPFQQTNSTKTLELGEQEKKSEYYDRIYIGWYDGSIPMNGRLPRPYVNDIEIEEDWSSFRFNHFSLRLNKGFGNGRGLMSIDEKRKTTFKFLSDTIPDVRAVFIIRGKRYLCEKISATFTENGMSQLLKGTFHPIIDD